jgi:hypothetical protein
MTDDQDSPFSEIQRLRKTANRWRAVAIAALVLVFVVMLPFTVAINHGVGFLRNRELEGLMRELQSVQDEMNRSLEAGEKQDQELKERLRKAIER